MMTDIDKLTQTEVMKNYSEFSTKAKMSLSILMMLWMMSYLVCVMSLFFWDWFMISTVSFMFLFLLIYFMALDCYKVKFRYIFWSLFRMFLIENMIFIMLLWFSRYLVTELILFNVAIWTLLFLLCWQLNHRTWFSPFAYFTEWWFLVTTLLTVFFCVLMVWKYTQIPFTCDDIENFPTKVVESTTNSFKNTRNKIVSWFKGDDEEILNMPEFYAMWNPLSKSEDLASADKVESSFMYIKNIMEDQTVSMKNEVSKSTCKSYLPILQSTQSSWWIQIAWMFIWYLLLVWIFKILLWVVSMIWFMLFMILRMFGVYKYEKSMVEKEVIV